MSWYDTFALFYDPSIERIYRPYRAQILEALQPRPGHTVLVPACGTGQDLPGLVARYGITDWLVPSVWPETFSYTTHEALATGLPVYAFDIGAQGDAVEKAENGRLIRFSADGNLAQNVLKRLAQDDEQAAKDGHTGQ